MLLTGSFVLFISIERIYSIIFEENPLMQKLQLCLIIILISGNQSFAQADNSSLAISIGNNGQIDKVLDHYVVYNRVKFQTDFDINNSFQNDLKFGLHMKLGNDSIADWNIVVGYGLRSGTFDSDIFLRNGKYSQSVYSLSVGRNWNLLMRKFILSAGVSIPLFRIDRFVEDFDEHYEYYGWHVNYTNEGGWVSGVNGLTSVKYNFTRHFFLFSQLTAGLLYSQIGKETVQTISEKYGYVPGFVFPPDSKREARFTDLFFSKPEFCFGVGISF